MDIKLAVISVIFGLLPESIYFSLYFSLAKRLESRKLIMFALILATNLVLSVFFAFSMWYHFLFIFLMYGILWLLYRSQFIDIFLITSSSLILTILGFACYFAIPNYWVAAVANRMLMFIILFGLRNKLHPFYMAYRKVWDVHPDSKIKSITVRNISCITLNLLLYFLNICASISSNLILKG